MLWTLVHNYSQFKLFLPQNSQQSAKTNKEFRSFHPANPTDKGNKSQSPVTEVKGGGNETRWWRACNHWSKRGDVPRKFHRFSGLGNELWMDEFQFSVQQLHLPVNVTVSRHLEPRQCQLNRKSMQPSSFVLNWYFSKNVLAKNMFLKTQLMKKGCARFAPVCWVCTKKNWFQLEKRTNEDNHILQIMDFFHVQNLECHCELENWIWHK